MPTAMRVGRDGPHTILVPLRVPLFGREATAINSSIPELQAYLKDRHPEVRSANITYRNPRPEVAAMLHDAWIVIVVFNPFTKKLAERFADDVYDWMKKRFRRATKGHKRSRRVVR